MNIIQYLAAINAVASSIFAGTVDVAQCNGRSALWLSSSLCEDSSKCTEYHVLPAPAYEIFDITANHDDVEQEYLLGGNGQCDGRSTMWMSPSICTDTQDEDQVKSILTNFMTWASLTRDVEMQKEGQELCEATNENMPWDMQMCSGDIKLVHRTQPMLGHSDYNFDPKSKPAMSEKGKNKIKSRFGLPREKVRNFVNSLKLKPMHWRKIPVEL